jgi:aminopeptidase N
MKRLLLFIAFCLTISALQAQTPDTKPALPRIYREAPELVNDLVHTKLEARFDYAKSQLLGKVWLTLKPHFYATDSLLLDAKGMDIKTVSLVAGARNIPLKYTYDGLFLNLDLNRKYKGGEPYTIYIDYIAKPNEFEAQGSAAITDAKGLYFINPTGREAGKPTQIWTQGETEATSVWVPTIDKPNQKTTQEFYLTVPAKYVSLSNGRLVSQKSNSDGTRTDYWKMDLPHAPYLFFIGVGDYAVIKDSYKGKEVSYHVEKEYAPVARKIFGGTPEMMALFSKLTGVEYPWVKYAQITGQDYVSGAMENTTATLHGSFSQQDARELTDGNKWEDVIAHELFHQWFGNYVTTESWSNLSLNESFATLGSQLWNEYKYGRDAGDAERYSSTQGYLQSGSDKKDLIRFYYNNKEDMFDAVSYNKGGAILQMLRSYVGDSAFFKALNIYLTANKFKAAEAHHLRLAFEEVTGKDLNWFFNQWYFGAGHPKLDIRYSYDDAAKKAIVIVSQNQTGDKLFKMPIPIDIYSGAIKKRYNVWVQNKVDTFAFDAATKPDLINFDADKTLLAQKTENKTLDNYLHQYKYTGNYIDRREAIDAAAKKQEESRAVELLLLALNDKWHGLRSHAVSKLDLRKEGMKAYAEPELVKLAQSDPKRTVKAAAIAKLGEYRQAKYAPLFKTAINDSSYTVAGNALEALSKIDSTAAYSEAQRLMQAKTGGALSGAVSKMLIQYGDESAADVVLSNFETMPLGQEKFEALQPLSQFLGKVKSLETFKRGVDGIQKFHLSIPEAYRSQVTPFIEGLLKGMQKGKTAAGLTDQAAYIETTLGKKDLKGF